MAAPVLDTRTLNRTLLLRQGLLERCDIKPLEMIERLVGMQAQVPWNPYLGLWSRLHDFRHAALEELIESRGAVRAGLMRSTLHLVPARDCLALAPLVAPLRARVFRSPFAPGLEDADLDQVVDAARALVAAAPLTLKQIGDALAQRFPRADPASLGAAAAFHLELVQIPPRGLWRRSMQPTWVLTEDFLGAPLERGATLDEFVLRYLRAFGPAAPADVRAWCGLTGLRPVIDRLRPHLRPYSDERGRELLDLEDGEIADPETPAPVRFLPEYDNVWLSHDDRSRISARNRIGLDQPRGTWKGSVLIGGFVRAHWRVVDGALEIDRLAPAADDPPGTAEEIAAEGARLVEFLAAPATA